MIKAAITPGIQPKQVRMNTITIDPQPLSTTAKGGKITHNITLRQPINNFLTKVYKIFLGYNVINWR